MKIISKKNLIIFSFLLLLICSGCYYYHDKQQMIAQSCSLDNDFDSAECVWNIAVGKKDYEICEEIQSIIKKITKIDYYEECRKKVAIASSDLSGCNKLKNENIKYLCISDIAKNKKDESICEMLTNKNDCLYQIGKILKDKNVCGKITEESLKKDCITETTDQCSLLRLDYSKTDEQYECGKDGIKNECLKNSDCFWQKYQENTDSKFCTCCPKDISVAPERCLMHGE
jgi:hypothetical protein